jgi:hypothetical protein
MSQVEQMLHGGSNSDVRLEADAPLINALSPYILLLVGVRSLTGCFQTSFHHITFEETENRSG